MGKAKASTGTALPPNWRELKPLADDVDAIRKAHTLLITTLPGRYDYDERDLMRKMIPRRNRPGNPGGAWIPGLRIFVRNDDKMTVFYFLRMANQTLEPAYCMTVGADRTVTKDDVYKDVLDVCTYLSQDTGGHRLEILNQDMFPVAFPAAADNLRGAFQLALSDGKLNEREPVAPGPPWPEGDLNVWRIQP